MKEQNPDIPFVVTMYYDKGTLQLHSEEAVDALILDPRGALLCGAGIYYYFPSQTVCNQARVLRDNIRSQRSKKVSRGELRFLRHDEAAIDSDLGKAIEAMSNEIKTLQKKYEESYPEATNSG